MSDIFRMDLDDLKKSRKSVLIISSVMVLFSRIGLDLTNISFYGLNLKIDNNDISTILFLVSSYCIYYFTLHMPTYIKNSIILKEKNNDLFEVANDQVGKLPWKKKLSNFISKNEVRLLILRDIITPYAIYSYGLWTIFTK